MTAAGVVRTVAVTVLCAVALLVGAGPAAAHTRLEGSDPADGSSTATAPARVSLRFSETMQADFSTLTVVGPDGGAYQTGPVTADGATVSTQVLPLGPAGRYEIGYRVVSDDGHPVTGSVAFTLTAPGAALATPPARTVPPSGGPATDPTHDPSVTHAAAIAERGDGAPVWPWIAGAVVLVAGGVAAALRLGRG